MIAALQELVVLVLRTKGFSGSFPHFRRRTDTAIHLLTFQFNKYGGSFVVEVASCGTEGRTAYWGKQIPPKDMRAHDVHPNLRVRLGSTAKKPDHWFKFDSRFAWNPYKRAAKAVLPFLNTQAEKWWSRAQENVG
jgi:hypothetical protein